MREFLQSLGMKAMLGAAGVAAMLGWWTLTGSGDGSIQRMDELPAVVLDGGAGVLSLDFEVSQPAVLEASFSRWQDDMEDEEGISVEKEYDAGSYREIVELPRDAFVHVEIGIPEATPGAKIAWSVDYDGHELMAEDLELDEPLKGGYAFFVQFEADGVEEIRDSMASR
ncbi:MAG: hypothetical protein OEQ13_07910 [Acidobacteriota bacterium]|nr:hypothetical protein [Acidobacteriota bacterium]